MVGAEALVRWQHPRLGLLGPELFVELAEQNGLMQALTGRVLREVAAQTGRCLMKDPGRALAAMQLIADRGIGISIDDYGTGYSSLSYLNDLPATELKIDRSFTTRLTRDPRTAEIVAGTVDLAHRLGMRLLAEGVEDDATLAMIEDLGCDDSQGYLHSRPLPGGRFLE